jgi:hypothetical protein
MKLLSPQASNAKLSKNASITDQWETSILYLAPAMIADGTTNLCPGSTPGCRAACLYSAGRGQMNSVQEARVRKARWLINRPRQFVAALVADLERLVKRQRRTGIRQAVRLNGTSDVDWSTYRVKRDNATFDNVFAAFSELQFYDYTKVGARIGWSIPNYHLTFSASEVNGRAQSVALSAPLEEAI